MEKDNKRKATPDINEEMMMNLMVDGVKKDGIQLPPEPIEKMENELELLKDIKNVENVSTFQNKCIDFEKMINKLKEMI